MSKIIKEIIRKKLTQLSAEELMNYADQYGFSLTQQEAKQIIMYLRQYEVDPFSVEGRKKMIQQLARITDQTTAQKAQQLFSDMVSSYGLDHLFR
ncbi:DUF2624 family protein [Virgibacillus proomii]|jgi:collagenase-like PrtC family protease|uniref:DUF2624 family protein n=1 Tax=Virgibacillus proomii TaxID=84407 RepID=UPI00098605CE|nr:DUF2624 family protein [Virgibacillus proomii]